MVGTSAISATEEVVSRRVRVVIVDDSDDVRLLLRVMLQHDRRFEVVGEAADGFEAIERAGETQPDLVVLDLSMPRLGGIEALPQIRENAPDAAVVLYTAQPDPGAHHAALAAGAIDVVEKTVIGDALMDQLATALLEYWDGPAAHCEVQVGPVDSGAAIVWIDNTKAILAAVRQHPDSLEEPVGDDVLDTFDRFLEVWREVASTSATFRWVARAEPAEVRRLVESWAVIDRLTDDGLHALGCDWSPPEGVPFFAALSAGVLAALDAHAETRQLAEELRPAWQELSPDDRSVLQTK